MDDDRTVRRKIDRMNRFGSIWGGGIGQNVTEK